MLRRGLTLSPAARCWQRRVGSDGTSLTFALEVQRAECEFLTGDFAAAEERLSMLSRRAEDLTDSSVVARLQTELYAALDQNDRAVAAALEYLRRTGVDWSAHRRTTRCDRSMSRSGISSGTGQSRRSSTCPP